MRCCDSDCFTPSFSRSVVSRHVSAILSPVQSCTGTKPPPVDHVAAILSPVQSCIGAKPPLVDHVAAILSPVPVLSRHQATAGRPRGRLPSTLPPCVGRFSDKWRKNNVLLFIVYYHDAVHCVTVLCVYPEPGYRSVTLNSNFDNEHAVAARRRWMTFSRPSQSARSSSLRSSTTSSSEARSLIVSAP